MTDEKDAKAVEPTDDHTDNIEDAVVVKDVQEVVSDEPAEDAVADGVAASDTERKPNAVLPLVVAGFICAGLGFGAAILSQPSNPIWPVHPDMAQFRDETTGQITGIDTRLKALEGRVTEVDKRAVGDVFQSDLDELSTGYDQRFSEITSQLENFDKRLAALEKSTIESAIPDELKILLHAVFWYKSVLPSMRVAHLTPRLGNLMNKLEKHFQTSCVLWRKRVFKHIKNCVIVLQRSRDQP